MSNKAQFDNTISNINALQIVDNAVPIAEYKTEFNMLQLVVDVFSSLLFQINRKHVSVKVKVCHNKHLALLRSIEYNQESLKMILYNFIANSVDMVRDNGKITFNIDLQPKSDNDMDQKNEYVL